MRKEIYEMLCERLFQLAADGSIIDTTAAEPQPAENRERMIKHVDLWNHNVEFIEQEAQWERPAVFVEFHPITWNRLQGFGQYHTRSRFSLHVVVDWPGSTSADSAFRDAGLDVFALLDSIHSLLVGASGKNYSQVDLVESQTNHNHEELVEYIETYSYKGMKELT